MISAHIKVEGLEETLKLLDKANSLIQELRTTVVQLGGAFSETTLSKESSSHSDLEKDS